MGGLTSGVQQRRCWGMSALRSKVGAAAAQTKVCGAGVASSVLTGILGGCACVGAALCYRLNLGHSVFSDALFEASTTFPQLQQLGRDQRPADTPDDTNWNLQTAHSQAN